MATNGDSPWIRNTRAWRQLLRAISVVPWRKYNHRRYTKRDDKGSSSTEERLLQTARFYFAFQRIVFFAIRERWEREGGGIVDEMDFFFFFFNFLSIGWLERKNENFFCNIFFLIMIATFYVISLNNRYKLDWWFNDDIFLGYNMLEYFDKS